ncbi:MAG: RCC1 domain-containing protein, partial [Actinomycetes bacterium]
LNSGGTVFCWGSNGALQLGQEDATLTALVPVAVSGNVVGVSGVTGIEAGSKFTCVLTNNSGIRGAGCWGADILDPTPAIVLGLVFVDKTLRARPVGDLSLVDKIVDISAGRGHSCALLVDGTVRCWGLGDNGELNGLLTRYTHEPQAVPGLAGVTSISAGTTATCATNGDRVACWGLLSGVADGGPSENVRFIGGVRGATQVAVGSDHACALIALGQAQCWGFNSAGRLGDGEIGTSPPDPRTPRPVVASVVG